MAQGIDDAKEAFLAAALLGERADASMLVAELLADGSSPESVILDVLASTQRTVGDRWLRHELSVGQEHLVSWITECVLSSMTVGFEPVPSAGHIILACADGELHGLPGRMAAELLMLQGWRVTYLGAPTPAASLAEHVGDLDADTVGISCTVPEHLLGAARSIAAAKAAGAVVVCGGAAFGDSPRRARNLGAHGWLRAADAGLDLDRCLFEDPLPTPLFGEWNVIEDNVELLVAEALEWLGEEQPELLAPGETERRRCRDEMRSSLRTGAAAVLTEDPLLVKEHLLWLRAYRGWGNRNGTVTRAALDSLAAVTSRIAPHVSGLLSQAARIDS